MLKIANQIMVDDLANGSNVIVRGKCIITNTDYEVSVPLTELTAWSKGGLAQNTLKSLNADQREFLISGISPAGWERCFGESCKSKEGGQH